MLRSAALLLACLLNLACSPERPPERSAPPPASGTAPQGGAPRGGAALKELADLAELVVVGTVEHRLVSAGGTSYEVLVREVLRQRPVTDEAAAAHPRQVGTRLKVSTFLFRSGRQPGVIGPLDELGRYLLFLSPAERPGEWLHLADPAQYPLPEAQPALDDLRRTSPQPGAGARKE